MPALRDYMAVVDGTDGLGMRREMRIAYGTIQLVSARDLACPDCPAGPGQDCQTGRMSTGKPPVPLLCPARIAMARELRDRGELVATEIAAARHCTRCAYFSGKAWACDEHRCQATACTNPTAPGSSWCSDHAGSRQKVTPQVREEMNRLRADGMSKAAIARQLGVSAGTVYNYLQGT